MVERTLLGVTEVDGQLHATRQPVSIVDHGTGTAPTLAAMGPIPEEADRVVETEVGTGRLADQPLPGAVLGDVTIHLHPAGDDEVTAVVSLPGRPRDRLLTRPAGEIAAGVVGLLTRERLDLRTGTHLHGAALADEEGRAVVVLGVSGTGKSTMAAHLAATGLDLLTDEQIRVHPTVGVVSAFTRPVVVKREGAAHLPEPLAGRLTGSLLSATDLGTRWALTGRPALVVLPERTGEAGREQLGSLNAVEALAANNLDLEAEPRTGLEALAWLAAAAPVVRLRHRSSAELAETARRLLEDPPAPAPPLAVEPAVPGARDLVTVTAPEGALVLDPSTMRLVRLNPAGAVLWRERTAGWPTDGASRAFRDDLERLSLL